MKQHTDSTDTASVAAFWDRAHRRRRQPVGGALASPLEQGFWRAIGDLAGRELLEIGCGTGEDTLRYAAAGARITCIDISQTAVRHARDRLAAAGLAADIRVLDAFDIAKFGKTYDIIAGRYILHHLEPFDHFAAILAGALKPGGTAVFLENNASNPVLRLARNHLAGRFGIPKHGDAFEHPLTAREIDQLRRYFASVTTSFPELVFLRKLNTYLFRGKPIFRPAMRGLDALDNFLWRRLPVIRPWSYAQLVVARRL